MHTTVSKAHTFLGHKDCVYVLEKSGEDHLFFSGSGDGMVVSWNLKEPDKGRLLAKVSASVYALCYDAASNYLIVGQNFDGIHVIDIENRKEVKSVKMTSAAIFDIQVWENKILVGAGDGVITILDKESLSVIKHIKASDEKVRAFAIYPAHAEMAVGYSDNTIKIISLTDYKVKKTINAHQNSVFTVAYSPDYQFLLSGSRDAHLKIWETENYKLKESIVAHMYTINHIAYSPDGKYFVTCGMDKSIKIWDAARFKLLKVIDKARHAGHGTSVNKLLWLNYQGIDISNPVVSASDDRSINVWNVQFAY